MHLRVYSDIHLECAQFAPPALAADAVILAGDIAEETAGLTWAREAFDAPIIYVAGNHEFYGQRLPDILETFALQAARLGIKFLVGQVLHHQF